MRKPSRNPIPQVLFKLGFYHVPAPVADLDPALDFKETTNWLAVQRLAIKLALALLQLEGDSTRGPTGHAFISQYKLIATFSEMTPFVTMKAFIEEAFNPRASPWCRS